MRPAAAPRRTLTVIITLQAHQLLMAQIVDGIVPPEHKGPQVTSVANALPIQCTYKQQFGYLFGDRVKQLLDPANAPPQCPPPILEESGKVRI